jgi:hypothetical protein
VFVSYPSQDALTMTGLQGKKGQGPPGTPKGLINTRQLKKGHKTYTCNG